VVAVGYGVMTDAQRRGGDWAGLAVLATLLFCVLVPSAIGLLSLAGAGCLLALRRRMLS